MRMWQAGLSWLCRITSLIAARRDCTVMRSTKGCWACWARASGDVARGPRPQRPWPHDCCVMGLNSPAVIGTMGVVVVVVVSSGGGAGAVGWVVAVGGACTGGGELFTGVGLRRAGRGGAGGVRGGLVACAGAEGGAATPGEGTTNTDIVRPAARVGAGAALSNARPKPRACNTIDNPRAQTQGEGRCEIADTGRLRAFGLRAQWPHCTSRHAVAMA